MTGEALNVRRYAPEDQGHVLRLHDEALHAAGAHLGDGPWDADLLDIEGIYLEDGGEFFVGTRLGRVVAMGALRKTAPGRAEITRMRVDPAFWRRGFGQTVLSALERRAVELGFTALRLDTAVHQEAARFLYEKNGYRETRRGRVGPFETVIYEKDGLV